jgi:hypothetical protein
LHTILLGVVKYFWRDATSRLDERGKTELRTRLDCLDVRGLDPSLSALNGKTLVQYAGSLVGRDFRHLVQVAPFVLEGLVPPRIYDAWRALVDVAVLAWKPEILDIDEHLVSTTIMITLAVTH